MYRHCGSTISNDYCNPKPNPKTPRQRRRGDSGLVGGGVSDRLRHWQAEAQSGTDVGEAAHSGDDPAVMSSKFAQAVVPQSE